MDTAFTACAECTHACFKEHGADGTKAFNANHTRSPCFLLTSVEISSTWTPIPREFVAAHGETLRGAARILGANGKEWEVEVGGPAKLLGFKGGWKHFVASNSLKRGDQVLFSLVSTNCFSAYVFNKLGVQVAPAPSVVPKYVAPGNGKRKKPEVKDGPVSDESDSESSDISEYELSKSDADSPSDDEDQEFDPPNDGDDGEICTVKRRVKSKFTVTVKKVKSEPSVKKKALPGSITKDGMIYEPGSMTTTYESLRREITQAERDRTMAAAQSLQTEHSSVPVLMMPSHVYRGFWLTIPGKFSNEYLPPDRIKIKLEDIHGFQWPAMWIKSDKHTGVSGGWAAFSKDHCLEEGDVCVFEVKNSQDWTILVHIYRVVPVDLEPGTRGGWEKTYRIVHGAMMNRPIRPRESSAKKRVKSAKTGEKILVKKTNRNTTRARACKGYRTASSSDQSGAEDDDLPLTKLFKGKSDSVFDELDVKPKIISMGPIPKIAKVKQETGITATVKVKQEPGVPALPFENGVHCSDVKPTVEQLRASLKLSSSEVFQDASPLNSAAAVKPEPVEAEALGTETGRTWYPVVKILGKRKNEKSSANELLVVLKGTILEASSACEDGNENWWVPRSQFSPDLSTCYVN